MKTVEFTKEFRHRTSSSTIKVYPAGWKGLVEDEVAAAARKDKVLAQSKKPDTKKTGGAGNGGPKQDGGANKGGPKQDGGAGAKGDDGGETKGGGGKADA